MRGVAQLESFYPLEEERFAPRIPPKEEVQRVVVHRFASLNCYLHLLTELLRRSQVCKAPLSTSHFRFSISLRKFVSIRNYVILIFRYGRRFGELA